MAELFKHDVIPIQNLNDIFGGIEAIGDVQGIMTEGQVLVRPRIIGGISENMTFKSADSGARIEIFPEHDTTIGMIIYDDAEGIVFKAIVSGADVGDIIIGDYAGGQGMKYDKSAGTMSYAGVSSTKTFLQAAIPTSENIGDLWVDSDDGNKVYRAACVGADQITAGEWVETSIEWAAVGDAGSTKPDNNANVGATAGSDLKESGGSVASQLAGLFADMGSITAGDITLSSTGFIKGGQTAYNTGTGFWLGYSSGYKFSIGNPLGNHLTWDGSILETQAKLKHVAGDIIAINNMWTVEADGVVTDATYTQMAETTIKRGGILRIKFTLNKGSACPCVYGKIYRGATPVGTERTRSANGAEEFSEDISGWSPSDEVRLYCKCPNIGGGGNSHWRYFKICVGDFDEFTATDP